LEPYAKQRELCNLLTQYLQGMLPQDSTATAGELANLTTFTAYLLIEGRNIRMDGGSLHELSCNAWVWLLFPGGITALFCVAASESLIDSLTQRCEILVTEEKTSKQKTKKKVRK